MSDRGCASFGKVARRVGGKRKASRRIYDWSGRRRIDLGRNARSRRSLLDGLFKGGWYVICGDAVNFGGELVMAKSEAFVWDILNGRNGAGVCGY